MLAREKETAVSLQVLPERPVCAARCIFWNI